jgi:hypothetical protein
MVWGETKDQSSDCYFCSTDIPRFSSSKSKNMVTHSNLPCGTDEETSVHILCKCEALASLRYKHLGSFFLDPEDIRELGIGAIWSFGKGTGLL